MYEIQSDEIVDIRYIISISMSGGEVEEVVDNNFSMTFEEVNKIDPEKYGTYGDRDLDLIHEYLADIAILTAYTSDDDYGRDEQEHELEINMQRVENGKVFFYVDIK